VKALARLGDLVYTWDFPASPHIYGRRYEADVGATTNTSIGGYPDSWAIRTSSDATHINYGNVSRLGTGPLS
jgi:hypothetical protein